MIRTLVNANPIAELQQVADMMDRAFSDLRTSFESNNTQTGWSLPVDVFERENTLVVRAAVPGVQPDKLDISVDQNVLTIQGEMKHNFEENDVVYRREYRYGSFMRSIRLPENIDLEGISAEFDHGFVTITIPKIVPVKPEPKKIEVRSTGTCQQALQQNAQGSEQGESATNGSGKKKVEAKQPAHLS